MPDEFSEDDWLSTAHLGLPLKQAERDQHLHGTTVGVLQVLTSG